MPTTSRIYFLDAARAILMFLGIPYHVGLAYHAGNEWIFPKSVNTSVAVAYLAEAIHTFRMPAFFALAGYFAMMALERKPAGEWFKGRLLKLGVPLVAGILLLNPIALIVLAPHLLTAMGDHWMAHLWFLPTLIALFSLVGLMQLPPLMGWFDAIVDWVTDRPVMGTLVVLGFAFVLSGAGSLLGNRVPDVFLIRTTIPPMVGYLPFVLIGMAMRSNTKALAFMSTFSMRDFVITAVGLWYVLTTWWGDTATNIMRIAMGVVIAIGMMRAVLAFCRRWLNVPSRRLRNLADASFTMYLVHFPLFAVFHGAIAVGNMPVLVEYVVLTAVVSIGSYWVHVLIAGSAPLIFLFNGVAIPKVSKVLPGSGTKEV